MTADLPIHVQMLMALRTQVQTRQRELEGRIGLGVEEREYQRHVGRIAECKVQIQQINEMMKADLDDVSDYLEADRREHERTQRATPGDRTGQRRTAASTHNRWGS